MGTCRWLAWSSDGMSIRMVASEIEGNYRRPPGPIRNRMFHCDRGDSRRHAGNRRYTREGAREDRDGADDRVS